ncbi:MAG: TatD family hydrolase [Clostridiales Family XIII bacterium]|jgi:TatD DNase family protein|nr:TatD family hydrolase [Clostridiales Family XIII bacterium]
MERILFDSHMHIDAERAELIRQIEASCVAYVVDTGYDLSSSLLAAQNAKAYEWCYAAVGIHPLYSEGYPGTSCERQDIARRIAEREEDIPLLSMLTALAREDGVKAVGEIGLDYHKDGADKARQQQLFRAQIRLARALDLPVTIHDREAHGDTMDILKEEKAFDGAGVLLHSYSGSAQQATEYARLGAMLSIAGSVTWEGNRKTVAAAKAIPADNLLIETDAPFMTPEPYRGQKNSPPLLEYTARKVAELRGVTYEELAETTLKNGLRFYRIEQKTT